MKKTVSAALVLAASLLAQSTLAEGAPADPPKKEEKKPKLDPFAGSSLFTQLSTETTTFFPSQQLYRGATTDVTMYFLPRYSLSKDWQLRGRTIVSDLFSWTVLVSATWWKFSPAVLFNMSHEGIYTFGKDQVPTDSGSTTTATRIANPQTIRHRTYFSFWFDFEANSWLTPELGYYMIRRLLRDDGSYGNPFFDSKQDMRVYLGANIAIDNLVKALQGEDGDPGIVRAKNTTGPALGAF